MESTINLIINFTLFLTTAGLAILGFLGKAWKDGRRSKIHWHGILVVVLVLTALVLQVWKQKRSEHAENAAKDETKAAQERLYHAQTYFQDTQEKLLNETRTARLDAAKANGKLEGVEGEVQTLQSSLNESQTDAANQSSYNIITSLSNSDTEIHEIILYLPLTQSVRQPKKLIDTFVPDMKDKQCENLMGIRTGLWAGEEEYELFDYNSTNEEKERAVRDGGLTRGDEIGQSVDFVDADSIKFLNNLAEQKDVNGSAYIAAVRPDQGKKFAAQFFSQLTLGQGDAFAILVMWPASFINDKQLAVMAKSYPEFYPNDGNFSQEQTANLAKLRITKECENAERDYLHKAFHNGLIVVDIGKTHAESIVFRVTAKPPTRSKNGVWIISFEVKPKPHFYATGGFDDIIGGIEDDLKKADSSETKTGASQ